MKFIRKLLRGIRFGRSGQTALEYALVIAVVVTVVITAAKAILGSKVQTEVFDKSVKAVSDQIK